MEGEEGEKEEGEGIERGCKVEVGGGIADIPRLMEMEWKAECTRAEGYELILFAQGNKAKQFVWGYFSKREQNTNSI